MLASISILMTFLLLSGEFFSCCKINQAFALELHTILSASLGFKNHPNAPLANGMKPDPIESEIQNLDSHPHCHGHALASEQKVGTGDNISENFTKGDRALSVDGSCLSERAITKLAMAQNISFDIDFIHFESAIKLESSIRPVFIALERPRPQNKSGPPLFIFVRQILV